MGEKGKRPSLSGPTPGATSRRCLTPRRHSLSRPASRCRYATSRPSRRRNKGTIYRHFPTRADLIIAVTGNRSEACAEAGPALLASSASPHAALGQWISLFVDFLATKHGLAAVLQSDNAGFDALHAYFLDRLVPVCAQLLDAAAEAGEIRPDVDAYELMRGVGNLCIGADNGPRYDARPHGRELLIADYFNRARPDADDPHREHLQCPDKVGLGHSPDDI